MAREPQHRLFAGIYNSVVAIDPRDGSEMWRTKLGGTGLPNVLWDGEALYATAKGEVFCLDPRDGAVLWNSPLKRLGFGLVTLASTRRASETSNRAMISQAKRDQETASAAAT